MSHDNNKIEAFAGLGILLADSVPGARWTAGEVDGYRAFRLHLPEGADLTGQKQKSLDGLMLHAEGFSREDFPGGTDYIFWI